MIVAAGPRSRCRSKRATKIDVDQLVAVQREHRPVLFPQPRRISEPASTAQTLAFGRRDDVRAEALELALEQRLVPGRAADDHPLDAGRGELFDLVGHQGAACHRDERLRPPGGGVAEPLRRPAGEDDRLGQEIPGFRIRYQPISTV